LKHVEAYSKLIIKQDFCALIWLITKNVLRFTVSKAPSVSFTAKIVTAWSAETMQLNPNS